MCFCLAAQEELNDYYRLLAVLEQELQATTKAGSYIPRVSASRPSDLLTRRGTTGEVLDQGVSAEDIVTGPSGLTLLRLKAWLQEPIERYNLILHPSCRGLELISPCVCPR
jgi:hypothetical protein